MDSKMRNVLKSYKRPIVLVLAVFVSLAVVTLFRGVFATRNVDFRFRVADAGMASRLQRCYAFYTTKEDPVQSERQRVKVDVEEKSKDGFMAVHIPGNAISFRFDLSFADDGRGRRAQPSLELDVDAAGELRKVEVPFRKDLANYAWKKFDAGEFATLSTNYYAMASAFCLLLVFSTLVLSVTGAFLRFAPNTVLVVGFAAILLLPAVRIESEAKSQRENRNLATFPNVGVVAEKGISAWCKAFENAFADRFFMRYGLMDVHSAITGLFDDRGNAKVLVGRDGWLFLKKTLEDFSNSSGTYGDKAMEGIRDYLNAVNDYAARNGKKFVFFIAPDKCRVYPEKVRFYLKAVPDSKSRTEKLVAYLREKCSFPIIYPREELLHLKSSTLPPLYHSGDTHWTDVGAYYGGYLPIMEALAINDAPLLNLSEWSERPWWGDLRLMLGKKPSEEFVQMVRQKQKKSNAFSTTPKSGYDANDGVVVKEIDSGKGDVQRVVKTKNPHLKAHSLYCLHDSFFVFAIPYFARSFSSVTFRHCRRGVKPEDMEDIDKCDAIVLEIVERDIAELAQQQVPMKMRKETR